MNLKGGKVYSWLTVLEISGHDHLALLLSACGKASISWQECIIDEAAHLMSPKMQKEEEEETRIYTIISLKVTSPGI